MRKAIEKLKVDTLQDLNRITSFVINTRMGYSLARDQIKIAHDKPMDDPRWTVALEIVSNFEFYEHRLLPKTAFLHSVGVFESFFFSLMHMLLIRMPKHLPEEAEIRLDWIVNARTREEIVKTVVEHHLGRLHHRPVAEWFAFFESFARLGVPTPEEVERLEEIFAARDTLFKPDAVVDERYLKRSGKSGRWKKGAVAETTPMDFTDACKLLQSLVSEVCDGVAGRIRSKSDPQTHSGLPEAYSEKAS